jgi:hypothetical protein
MRPFLIELLDKSIELGLLLQDDLYVFFAA